MTALAIGFAIFAAALIVEIVLLTKWNRSYFTLGLPIFARRIERTAGLEDISLEALQKSAHTVAGAPLLFQRIEPNLIIFREKAFGFGGSIHYLPIMRGVIRYDPAEASAVLRGMLNWWIVVFVLLLAVMLRRDLDELAWYLIFAVGILYMIPAVRYNRVAKALRAAQT